jgi:hypothetical protein
MRKDSVAAVKPQDKFLSAAASETKQRSACRPQDHERRPIRRNRPSFRTGLENRLLVPRVRRPELASAGAAKSDAMMGMRVGSSRACVARGGNCTLRHNDQDKFEEIAFLSVLVCPCESSSGWAMLMFRGSAYLGWKRDGRLGQVSDKLRKKFVNLR